jgi:hypothetical protein
LEKLRARGVDLQFSRLRLTWDRGIVAENVRFGPSDEPWGPRLTAAEVRLELNHQALAHLRFQIDSLLLRQGRLVWPIEQTNSPPPEIGATNSTQRNIPTLTQGPPHELAVENIQTELRLMPDDAWSLDNFSAGFAGARVRLFGEVANASAVRRWKVFHAERPPSARFWQTQIQQLADTLQKVHFSAPPDLKLDVRGDARDLQTFKVRLRVSAPGAETPWGTLVQGLFTARVLPATNQSLARAELRLNAQAIQTPWARATDLRFTNYLTWAESQNMVNADATASASGLETEWGRGTNAYLEARWLQALSNAVPLSGTGQLRCDQAETKWGSASNIRLSLERPADDPRLAAPESVEGGSNAPRPNAPTWLPSKMPSRFNWQAECSELHSPKLDAGALTAAGTWREPELAVTNLHAELYGGRLEARAGLDVITRAFDFSVNSNFEVKKLSQLTPKTREFLDQFTWEKTPQLQAFGSMVLPAFTNQHPDWHAEVQPTLRLQGEFKVSQGTFRGIPATSAQSHFTYSNMVWDLPDLIATRPEGWVQAAHRADDKTKDFYWRFHSTIDPTCTRALLEPKHQRAFESFTLSAPPLIDAEVYGRFHDWERTTAKAHVVATNLTVRGHALDRFETTVSYTNQFVTLTDAFARHGTQQLSAAGLAIDFVAQKIFLTNGFATSDPQTFARAIGPKVAQALEPYHFTQPPTVRVEGIIPIHDEQDADLWFDVKGGQFQWWKINVPAITGRLHWAGLQLSLNDVRAPFFGGAASGEANFNFSRGQGTDFQFDLAVTNARLELLMAALSTNRPTMDSLNAPRSNASRSNAPPNLEGFLSGSLTVARANSSDWRTYNGRGNVQLRDGLIWAIPIFGIFSPVLDGISPGLGSSRANAGTATFTITNGVIRSDDLEIRSPALRLEYRGTLDLQDQVNARVEAELLRDVWGIGPLISTVLWPVTKLFEYKVTGSLNQPKSDPVFFVPRIVLLPFHPFRTLKDLLPENPASANTNSPPVFEKIP